MAVDDNESKNGLVDYVVRLASYLPELLELVGTPVPVARAVRHAVRLVPAVRKVASSDASGGLEDSMNNRFTAILASHQELDNRCTILEQENTRMKVELAGVTSQVQLLQGQAQALRTEIESLKQRDTYLSVAVGIVFLMAVVELALRFTGK